MFPPLKVMWIYSFSGWHSVAWVGVQYEFTDQA
jgi:hypothetical protein